MLEKLKAAGNTDKPQKGKEKGARRRPVPESLTTGFRDFKQNLKRLSGQTAKLW